MKSVLSLFALGQHRPLGSIKTPSELKMPMIPRAWGVIISHYSIPYMVIDPSPVLQKYVLPKYVLLKSVLPKYALQQSGRLTYVRIHVANTQMQQLRHISRLEIDQTIN